VDQHTPKDAVIATHDIGLVGYITQRQIVDLAGLVTPEVIPLMSDQSRLAQYVRQRNVSYVIVFTGYYQQFLKDLNAKRVYSPPSEDLERYGLEPFEVFQIPSP
jgi:predicted ATP-grasp superfamily ATP-dependent carboligase